MPATAARAPYWGNAPTYSADFYGSEPYYDEFSVYQPGVVNDGDVDLVIEQSTNWPNYNTPVRVVSIDLGHSMNLTGYDYIDVYCEGSAVSPTIKVAGDEISITGLYCQDGGDGNSTIDVSVYARGLYGTTDSYFFSGERTEGQYRTNDNRRTKEYTWRIYANDFDFSLWD